MTTEPAIRVQGIEKSFKDLHVLRGVDFDVAAGQHLRAARLQRRRQDHAGADPVDAAEGRRGHRHGPRLRRRRRSPATCASRSA